MNTPLRRFAIVALILVMGVMAVGWASAQAQDDAQRGFLGVSLSEDTETGVTIMSIVADSAAETAGLQVGDVITGVNGTEIASAQEVADAVGALSAGDTVSLDISRDGEAMTVEVTLGERPASADESRMPFGNRDRRGRNFDMPDMQLMPGMGMMGMMMGNGRLGVSFATLDADVAAENNVTLTDGALVLEVAEDSPAAEAGLQVNDVITAVNNEPVDAERTLRDRLIAYEPGDTVSLTVARGEETLTIEVTLAEQEMGSQFFMPFGEDGQFHFNIPGFGDDMVPEATPEATPEGANT
ncbi:MAG: PDZ domain-containing protein [Chloroflexi bacterium]|nr:PDZ domain-containing protein [Chloroflexota bacterium]